MCKQKCVPYLHHTSFSLRCKRLLVFGDVVVFIATSFLSLLSLLFFLQALYIYESKMALFARIAQSFEGAKVLLQAGLLSRLAECSFLDQRPEQERIGLSGSLYAYDQNMSEVTQDSFVPSVMERYRQLLMPALKVILAILTSLGSQHKDASIKVM